MGRRQDVIAGFVFGAVGVLLMVLGFAALLLSVSTFHAIIPGFGSSPFATVLLLFSVGAVSLLAARRLVRPVPPTAVPGPSEEEFRAFEERVEREARGDAAVIEACPSCCAEGTLRKTAPGMSFIVGSVAPGATACEACGFEGQPLEFETRGAYEAFARRGAPRTEGEGRGDEESESGP